MNFRDAEPSDLDQIVALEHEIFPEDAWPREQLEADVRSDYARFRVAVDGENVVGYAIGLYLPGNDVADIHNIAVRNDHRGSGIGAAMFDDLLAWGRESGAAAMMLEVRADNVVAQSLYASRGFEVIATRPGYYQPAGVDGLVMRREFAE